jgi:psp operon transcriptional activator
VRELKNTVERSLYRWPEPEEPVDELVFDPFRAPWADEVAGTGDAPVPRGVSPSSATAPHGHASAPSCPAKDTTGQGSRDASPRPLRETVDAYERRLLEAALTARDYHQGQTADDLGLTYHQLRGLLRKHGLRSRARRG